MATAFTKTLLIKGAAADTWAPSGRSALMIAAAQNKTAIMELLIQNHGSCAGDTAASNAKPAAVAMLAGADVQLLDGQKRTALMHAAMSDHMEAVTLLLEHGAQVLHPESPASAHLCVAACAVPVSPVRTLSDSHACRFLFKTHLARLRWTCARRVVMCTMCCTSITQRLSSVHRRWQLSCSRRSSLQRLPRYVPKVARTRRRKAGKTKKRPAQFLRRTRTAATAQRYAHFLCAPCTPPALPMCLQSRQLA